MTSATFGATIILLVLLTLLVALVVSIVRRGRGPASPTRALPRWARYIVRGVGWFIVVGSSMQGAVTLFTRGGAGAYGEMVFSFAVSGLLLWWLLGTRRPRPGAA